MVWVARQLPDLQNPFAPYGLAYGQKLVKSGSTWAIMYRIHIYETTGWIYTIWSSMELSRPVVMHRHGHLTLTMDFQGQTLKIMCHRNGKAEWHWTKRMLVYRILDPHCDFGLWPHPWPWPLIFKVKFWKGCNWGMECPIDMEWKGCGSTECWTHVFTFNFDLTYDLGLKFSVSNCEIALSHWWEGRLTWNERDMSR